MAAPPDDDDRVFGKYDYYGGAGVPGRFESAAARGRAVALNNDAFVLANCLWDGQHNFTKAREVWEEAAAQGHVGAEAALVDLASHLEMSASIKPGTEVTISSGPKYRGKHGTIVDFDLDRGRYNVVVWLGDDEERGKMVSLRPSCLKKRERESRLNVRSLPECRCCCPRGRPGSHILSRLDDP